MIRPFKSVGILFIFLLAVLLLWHIRPGVQTEESEIKFAKAKTGNFEIRLRTIGQLEAEKATYIGSQIKGNDGKLIYIIEDGAAVEKGDVLARLDPVVFEQEVERLQSRIREQESIVESLKKSLAWDKEQALRNIETAESALRIAELEYKRIKLGDLPMEKSQLEKEMKAAEEEWLNAEGYVNDLEELAERGFSHPLEIENAEKKAAESESAYNELRVRFKNFNEYQTPARLEAAEANHKKAQSNLEQVKSESAYKSATSENALNKALFELAEMKKDLEQAQTDLEKTIIHAPHSGLAILKENYKGGSVRKPHVGDTVFMGQPIIYLPDISSLAVTTRVREIDLHKIRIGIKSAVKAEAFPDMVFSGRIDSIGALAEKENLVSRGARYFRVRIALDEIDERLRPGMTVQVDILCDKILNALIIPVHAVFYFDETPYCFIKTDAGYVRRGIETDRRNEDWMEILSGLREGESVCLFQPEEWIDG